MHKIPVLSYDTYDINNRCYKSLKYDISNKHFLFPSHNNNLIDDRIPETQIFLAEIVMIELWPVYVINVNCKFRNLTSIIVNLILNIQSKKINIFDKRFKNPYFCFSNIKIKYLIFWLKLVLFSSWQQAKKREEYSQDTGRLKKNAPLWFLEFLSFKRSYYKS